MSDSAELSQVQRYNRALHAPQEVWEYLNAMPGSEREQHFGGSDGEWKDELDSGKSVCKLLLEWSKRGPYRDIMEKAGGSDGTLPSNGILSPSATSVVLSPSATSVILAGAETLRFIERRAQIAFRAYNEQFPTSIWHCCARFCFASIAIDPDKIFLFEELSLIHRIAERYHRKIVGDNDLIESRRRGIGGSYIGFRAPSRQERETDPSTSVSDRQRNLRSFATFVLKILPFLYGKEDAPSGVKCSKEKLCTESICCLLGVSRKFLYGRKKASSLPSTEATEASEQELSSIVDIAGARMRQHRRVGERKGYPGIEELPTYDCGCSEPCFSGMNVVYLTSEYNAFSRLSQELNPRRKENRYLLNVMFCPLAHCPTKVCDSALSALYTVSEQHISDVRTALQAMCSDPTIPHRAFLEKGVDGYTNHKGHPMNRYPDHVRESVENHLDMVLRADPAGANSLNVCRVYSPEVNTKEKLRKLVAKALEENADIDGEISQSTMQRMIDTYLESRKCTIEFTQSDHNACPNCKTLNYAVLQFHYETKQLEQKYESEFAKYARPFNAEMQYQSDHLFSRIETKRYQEKESLREFVEHNQRDAQIRQAVKSWSDYFRGIENNYRQVNVLGGGWNSMSNHAVITHQDDMTKVDLPHFVVNASADITRWRFDVNAHVSAVTKEAVVFSHEQGTGSKNSSSIAEMILLDHLVRCKGESIKIVVSDNAAVGKNWLTTIALPQYIIDQGLADIVMIVFLENNHGKWLADMLFGQWQTRRKRTTLLSIDDLLGEFEAVHTKGGKVHGFAVNPLSSVDFITVFESLGYETKPPKDFGFVKRNIHFAAACRQTAKSRLSPDLVKMFGSALPEAEGMVRISSSPPTTRIQSELAYEERYFDVPAARVTRGAPSVPPEIFESPGGSSPAVSREVFIAPLTVPMDRPFSSSGHGVVSQRTAHHVGFNGFEFRSSNGYPELRSNSTDLVKRAWPEGLLQPYGVTDSGEPVYGVESVKCAPENWVVRRPLQHFGNDRSWRARYPPRNLLNAKSGRGPREDKDWVPTKTYEEPPFPVLEGRAASDAMKRIASQRTDISKTVNFLDLLRAVYEDMGDRDGVSDPWLQRRVTLPGREALESYRNKLLIFNERWKGELSAPRTVRQVFKHDQEVGSQVTHILRVRGQVPSNRTMRTPVYTQLFEEASVRPGGLDRYLHLVEKDHERYAKELKIFKEKMENFDHDHGLLPKECNNNS